MNQKYKATGIVLQGVSLKESDRLVTILTSEYGLLKAVVPGAKKHKSPLRGRTELFVVNDLLIVSGRSLDKIVQAETIYTYPGLSRDLGKLAAAQYLAELVLHLALSEQPQTELYELFNEHLRRLERLPAHTSVYPYLAQGVFHVLALAGIAPQTRICCLTQKTIDPNWLDCRWQVGFSFDSGGVINLEAEDLTLNRQDNLEHSTQILQHPPKIESKLNAIELAILQQLNCESLHLAEQIIQEKSIETEAAIIWMRVEQVLRNYAQYHLGRSIRSASLVDNLYVEF
jgi:DNA repair protein RecO (recombination protein O)